MTIQEVKSNLKNPKSKTLLDSAIITDSRIKLHTEIVTNFDGTNNAVNEFFEYISKLMPSDKVFLFKSLFRFPVKTTEVTILANKKNKRVFDGVNPVMNHLFTVTNDLEDWSEYEERDFWRNEAWKVFTESFGSVLVVDLPQEQKLNSKPEPYKFFLQADEILDLSFDDKKEIEWITFRPNGDKTRLAFYDKEYYRVFVTKEGSTDIESIEVESSHELGYCPAKLSFEKKFKV